MSLDNLTVGLSGPSRFAGQRGRTAEGTLRGGVRYPSPFFDIGHTYLPPTIKALLRWCRYYYLTSPLINSAITKMSEYPITEIIVDEKEPSVKEKWEVLLGQHLRYRAFQIETGLDYFTYGMCVVTIHFPFTKYLICRHCKHRVKASDSKYRWYKLEYQIECKKCHRSDTAIVQDFFERDVRRIRLQRWNPEYIHIDPGFGGADPVYTFEIPLQLKNDIILGKTSVINTIPDVFIEAMKRNKFISFSQDNLFVIKRPIISQKDDGWGMPLILPVLKDAFYLQILRKSQEAIVSEHVIPLRILFPQPGSASSDPYSTTSLAAWRERVENEVAKWKQDSNYIPVMPLPVGVQNIGGDGKALMLYPEMQAVSDLIINGMGIPIEFIKGGMQFSGSNVSMRMVENMFLGYRVDHENMLNEFVIKRIASFMGWTPVRAHMRRFKMADDLQRLGLYFQLNQAQKVSDQTLLQEADQDPAVEEERRMLEFDKSMDFQKKLQLAQAHTANEAQLVQVRGQVEVQKIQAQAQMQLQQMQQQMMPQQAGQPQEGQDSQQQQGQGRGPSHTGQEGEMVPGQQVEQAMPQGSTVSMDNAQRDPSEGMPPEAASQLNTRSDSQSGLNVIYLAKRAKVALEKMDPTTKIIELNRMKAANPQLYSVVLQMMRKDQRQQRQDPTQNAPPQLKPSREQKLEGF